MPTATKSKPKKSKAPTVHVTLSTFDATMGRPVYRTVRDKTKLADFHPITEEDYRPAGGTPLLDATVEFIEDLRSRRQDDEVNVGLLLDESGSMGPNREAVVVAANKFVNGLRKVSKVDPKVAGKGFLVIATDGYENRSQKHDYESVRQAVSACEQDGWITVFLGADIDGWDQGAKMGFSGGFTGQMVSAVNTPAGQAAVLDSLGHDATSYLEDSGNYAQLRAATSKRSIAEDGSELSKNIGASGGRHTITPSPSPGAGRTPRPQLRNPRPSSGYSAEEALKRVRDEMS